MSTTNRPARHLRTALAPLPLAVNLALAAALGTLPMMLHANEIQASQQHYQIPAGPLGEALNRFAQQAGVAIIFAAGQVETLHSPGLSGEYSVAQGFALLLHGSGYSAVQGANGFQLKPVVENNSALELGETRVTGTSIWNDGTTESTGSYTQAGPSNTATGLALSLRETPQSITVVTRQKMDDFNIQTLKDAMSQTPGISVSTQGDSTRFWARGGEINNYQSDGSRLGQTTSSTGAVAQTNLFSDDMAEMDRIEVLKGSAGLLQGDGYPTATVNMIRKKPTHEFQASIGASAGSWDNYRTDVDVSGPLTEEKNVRARVVAAYKDGNSFRDNVQNRNTLLYGTLDLDFTPQTTLNVGASYKDRTTRGNAAYMGYQAYNTSGVYQGDSSRSWNSAAPWSGYEQESLSVFGTLEHRFDNDWTSKLYVMHENIQTPNYEHGAYYYREFARSISTKDIDGTTQNVSLQFSGPFSLLGKTHELVFGYDSSDYDYQAKVSDRRQLATAGTSYADGGGALVKPSSGGWVYSTSVDEQTDRQAFYATGRFSLTDDLKLISGFRSSDYDYTQSWYATTKMKETGVVTPFAGLVYDLNENFSFYGSYANVFQPVTVVNEQGQVLDPQEGVTYEIGSKAEFYDGRLNTSLSFFWKRWENSYELSGGLTPTGNSAYKNVSGVMEHGWELEVSGELAPGWQAQGGFVTNTSEYNETYFPKHQFKFNTTYQPQSLSRLTVGLGLRWQSEVATGTYAVLEQDAYWLADTMARYKLNQHLTLGMNVNNVFDKKYYAGVNTMGSWGEYYDWGEPRNLNVSMHYQF